MCLDEELKHHRQCCDSSLLKSTIGYSLLMSKKYFNFLQQKRQQLSEKKIPERPSFHIIYRRNGCKEELCFIHSRYDT